MLERHDASSRERVGREKEMSTIGREESRRWKMGDPLPTGTHMSVGALLVGVVDGVVGQIHSLGEPVLNKLGALSMSYCWRCS